ncbi:hypothetical protein II810_04715 [bacterium]|nr:hypothetical protein [bacterium]
MADLNLGNLISKFVNYQALTSNAKAHHSSKTFTAQSAQTYRSRHLRKLQTIRRHN